MISYSMTRHIVNNALPSCSKVILLLERAEDCHAVFGNQTQGHKYMTPISRTLNTMTYKARSRKETTDGKSIVYANFDFPSCKGPGHKRSLNIAEQLKHAYTVLI